MLYHLRTCLIYFKRYCNKEVLGSLANVQSEIMSTHRNSWLVGFYIIMIGKKRVVANEKWYFRFWYHGKLIIIKHRNYRRTIVRWVCLGNVMALRLVSHKVIAFHMHYFILFLLELVFSYTLFKYFPIHYSSPFLLELVLSFALFEFVFSWISLFLWACPFSVTQNQYKKN